MLKEEETQHCPLCEEWAEKYEELDKKYTAVLELAKLNADSNEYCIEGLEEINEKYRHVFSKIKEICEEKKKVGDWLAIDILKELQECEGNND